MLLPQCSPELWSHGSAEDPKPSGTVAAQGRTAPIAAPGSF